MNDSATKTKPLGYINFDGTTGPNNEVEIVVPHDRLSELRRGQYVLLSSDSTGALRHYLARIIRGPFYIPDAVSKDSAFARASILQADEVKFRPDFHGICRAEVLGELPDAESLAFSGAFSRPAPQTAVTPLGPERIKQLLGLDGDMYLGKLTGYPEVRVFFKSDNKAVIPRNLGIFGTVGSGKTNTSQVLIEEAAQAGFAVIVIDVEGEYVDMDKPSAEAKNKPSLRKRMQEFAVEPDRLKNLQVFHCRGTEPQRSDSREIGVRFGNISPYVLAELLDLSDVQHDLFLELYLDLERRSAPKLKKAKGLVGALTEDEQRPASGLALQDILDATEAKLADDKTKNKSSWGVLLRKFKRLARYGVFDPGDDLGDYRELLKPQLVSVFDLSGSQNVMVNNVLISDILRGLFDLKARDKKSELPRTLIVIEEAHTFVSRDNVKRMEETLDTLRDISRRGRKRWLALCFISQQPSHLPPEIYELCNTKVVHQTTGGRNLSALKDSAGGVNEAVWDEVPVLGQGRCLIMSPQFRHPVLCDVRPCKTQRKFTD